MQAEVRVHAVIDVNIADGPSEPLRACAAEVIQQIKAGATVLARGGATLIYLSTTVLSSVASGTQTGEGAMMVLQNITVIASQAVLTILNLGEG